jgi:hypothetical protein
MPNVTDVLIRSQVELPTAILCTFAPSLQPLFKHIFLQLRRLQRSKPTCHYYGGQQDSMHFLPRADATEYRPDQHDSINDLERPSATYELKVRVHNTPNARVVFMKLLDEEENQARSCAFSNHASSVQSYPTLPRYLAQSFTNG